jgi:uncharacterized damage-inducible protein DinB
MSEIHRILDQMQRAWDGNAWHGPPLRALLADVSVAVAHARPVAAAHTIAEIVLHLAYWKDTVRRRLAGETILPTEPEQWPAITDRSGAAWREALALLEARHRALVEAIARLDDSRLTDPIGGKDYDVYVLLHGTIQHELYHAGQVALLKKAAKP